jgi:hypothetical protein
MMSDPWTARLSDYLDGELSESERNALERHLSACPSCTGVLKDLARVADRARELPNAPPTTDLWTGIATRIGADALPVRAPSRRRWSFSFVQLGAACVAVAVASGSGVWLLAARRAGVPDAAIPARPVMISPMPTLSRPVIAEQKYDAAVAELEQVLEQGRGTLDTTTVHVLERNLALIDRAIADARRALAADPHNAYLNAHLAGTMRQKIDLLRQAAAIVAARS